MNSEIFLKNGIFLSLFLSTVTFWTQNLKTQTSNVEVNNKRPLKANESASTSRNEAPGQRAVFEGLTFAGFQRPGTELQPKAPELGSDTPLNFSLKTINIAEIFLQVSFCFITIELLFRWYFSGHPPLSNLYESFLFLLWGMIGFFLFALELDSGSEDRGGPGAKLGSAAKLGQGPVDGGLCPAELSPGPARSLHEPYGAGYAAPKGPDLDLELTKVSIKSPGALENLKNDQAKFSLRNFIGSLLSSTALFLITFADWRLPSEMREMKPLIPALQSNWLLMHVSIMILSYAALLIGCLLAIAYVVLISTLTFKNETIAESGNFQNPEQNLKIETIKETTENIISPVRRSANSMTADPTASLSLFSIKILENLDSLSYQVLAFAFPLLTLGILSGAVWANEAWGSYWSWDPKETWAFITWLIFAFYLHTRLQYGWEGKKSALVATFGFFIVWVCYLGVNLLGKGLHSYGWFS